MVELPDFDSLQWLAQHAPQQLAALQNNLNQDVINEAAERNRPQLESIYHHLKLQMSRCSNPYARCYLSLKLMNDKFLSLNEVINNPKSYKENKAVILSYPSKKAL
ncbi:DUF3135 domain-containing protein [Shewanella psychrotolerans]|uniref:DUF3135 domain-containing protein n=1 Tax=Shewanella psychrotolerans TaxID=2864206 RepID=UPI001C660F97|nr:DUF3135 domain-containing protein [Shewanella psychrotolerans]QYK02821.1 DUF3135 domain-containing protein [Shewanella psychrotolerans]